MDSLRPVPLSDRLGSLSPAKRALLLRRAAELDMAPTRHRVSTTQLGIWLYEQLQPGTSAYHNSAVLRATGPLDVAALGDALDRLQARHGPLRSRYVEDDDGEVWAVVAAPPGDPVRLRTDDVTGEPDPHQAAVAMVRTDCVAEFDIAAGPVWRALLVRYGPADRLLALTLHHIVSDGTSLGVLFAELGALYQASIAGRRARLPALDTSFFQLIEHREHGTGRRAIDNALTYWTTHLAGMPPGVALDRFAAADGRTARGAAGGAVPVLIDRPTTSRFDRWCGGHGASLFGGLAGMFALLLHVRTGQRVVPLLSPVDSRGVAGAGLVGCFVNNVVLRLEIELDGTVADVVAHAGHVVQAALANHEAPFGEVVAAASTRGADPRQPFSNVAVVHNNAPTGTVNWAGLQLRREPIPISAVRYDLALSIGRSPTGLSGDLEYAAHLAEAAVVGLAGDLTRLVELAAAGSDPRVDEVAARLDGGR